MKVIAINTGYIISKFNLGFLSKGKEYPVYIYLITINGKKILFDTGLSENTQLSDLLKGFIEFRLNSECNLENQLSKLNINCSDIDIVINSHLHLDHSGNNHLFKNKKILIQSKEIELVNKPKKHPSFLQGIDENDYHIINGQHSILGDDNLRLIPVEIHTKGHQILVIKNSGKMLVFSGDSCYIDEETQELRSYERTEYSDKYLERMKKEIFNNKNIDVALFSAHNLYFKQNSFINLKNIEKEIYEINF